MWQSEDNPWGSVLSFYHVDPGDQTQVGRGGSKHLYSLSHLDGTRLCVIFIASTWQSAVTAEIFKPSVGYDFLGFISNVLN